LAQCVPCPSGLSASTVGSTTCTANGLPVIESASGSSNSLSSGSIAGLIIGPIFAGLIGLVFWSIQRSKEWALHREEHPLAHALYEQMKLNYHNFKSGEGIQYVAMVNQLEKQLIAVGFKYGNVSEFSALTPKQRREVAVHIETALRSHNQGPKRQEGCRSCFSANNQVLDLDILLQDISLIPAICKQVVGLVGVVLVRQSAHEAEIQIEGIELSTTKPYTANPLDAVNGSTFPVVS
jgi:hypothetical protein